MNEKECATILKRLVYNKDDSEVYDAIIFAIRFLQQRERLVAFLDTVIQEDNDFGTVTPTTLRAIEQLLAEIKGEQKEPHMEKQMSMEELRKSEDRAVWVDGKGWDDRWAAKQMGQEHYYINSVEEEKHIPRGEAEKFAKSLKGDLLPVFILVSLYDYDKHCMVPAAVKMGFKTDDWYWAKEVAGTPGFARMVNLKSGRVDLCGKDYSNYVRCVRLEK
ncbi:MAG: hypothetical protein WC437_05610 [Patescibacteria group bacterium]|jgi:hypothetical protein